MSVPDILSMMVRVQVNRKIAGDWHFTRGKQHYTMSTQHIYLSACSDQGVLRQLWRLASTPTSADARHTCMNAHKHINTHTNTRLPQWTHALLHQSFQLYSYTYMPTKSKESCPVLNRRTLRVTNN